MRRFRNTTAIVLISASVVSVVGCMPASRRGAIDGTVEGGDHARVEQAMAGAELSTARRSILIEARRWLGTPYSYGGESRQGADCSGFVKSVFASVQIELPRTSSAQSRAGTSVPISAAEPGDLLFFNTSGSGVSHVGIVIRGKEFIHSSTSRGVIVSSLLEDYYAQRVLMARRVL